MFDNDANKTGEDVILKKVDIIRERMGISYREAKEALENNQGDLLKTLIDLEDKSRSDNTTGKTSWTEEFSIRSNDVIEKVKELIHQGNVNKIRIKHEGRVLADIPVSLGAIGAVVLPQLAALGVLVAVFKQCTIEVVRTKDNNPDSNSETENGEKGEGGPKNSPF